MVNFYSLIALSCERNFMVEVISYYWPKLVAGLWFAVFNLTVAKRAGYKPKMPFQLLMPLLFFTSSALMSIYAELVSYSFYGTWIKPVLNLAEYPLAYVPYNIFFDALFVFIGGMIFTYSTGLKNFQGATIYMQFVCIERLAVVIAVGPLDYMILFIIIQVIVYLVQWRYMPTANERGNYEWRRLYIYLMGLFYILDVLYGAYYIFPELGTDVVNLTNLLWLDGIAIITSVFILGYIKISFKEAQQERSKLRYLEKLQHSQENIIVTLAEITEAKSGETGQHIRRVAEYSRSIALRLLKDEMDSENIRIAAMMHDIGKLMIPQEILEKPGKLTDEEYAIIKEHSTYGWELLAKSEGDVMEMARIIAYQHHERWDGKGYPNGIKGDEISIYAQVVAVADVYDALTSKRSYKDAWSAEDAKTEIINQRGKQFSPQVVDAFVTCFDEIEEIRATYKDME